MSTMQPQIIDLDGADASAGVAGMLSNGSGQQPASAGGIASGGLYEQPSTEAPVIEAGAGPVIDEDGDDDANGLPKRAIRNDNGTVTLPLRYPVELQIRSAQAQTTRTERFDVLTFHRLIGADLRAITATSEAGRPVVMLAKSTRLRETVAGAVFDRMDGADIADATKILSFFIDPGPRTGR